MSTPHNQAQPGEIAKHVLMPGDPLRAKFIADTFLEDARLVNQVRNAFAYTGTYKGRQVSVMASGMGMPSIGIYSYELYSVYGVESIIRVGSSGAYSEKLNIYDVVLAQSAWSESSYARTQNGEARDLMLPSPGLNQRIQATAQALDIPLTPVRVHSSDVFYREESGESYQEIRKKHQCDCVEMESFALFHNAKVLGKEAACLLTISDSLPLHQETTAQERQTAFTSMMKIALETFCK